MEFLNYFNLVHIYYNFSKTKLQCLFEFLTELQVFQDHIRLYILIYPL